MMELQKYRMRFGLVMLTAFAVICQAAKAQDKRPTARQVVATIQEHVGVPWNSDTVDTFKAGNPDIAVTGIAVTMMATLDVLQRAAAKGQNLVITMSLLFIITWTSPKAWTRMTQYGRRSAHSSRNTGWWCGDFMITGIGETRMASSSA